MRRVLLSAQSLFQSLEERYGSAFVAFLLGVGTGGMVAFFWFYARTSLGEEIIFEPTPFQQDIVEIASPTQAITQLISPNDSEPVDDVSIDTYENFSSDSVNINTATQAQLESLPGIGPVIAQRIIEHRPYASIFDIQRVPGIGKKRYEQIADLISVER